MRQRAIRHVLFLVVLGAPLIAAIPSVTAVAKPAPARTLAVHAPGMAVALHRFERTHHAVRVRHAVHRPAAHRAATQLVVRHATVRHARILTTDLALQWPASGAITTPFIPSRHDGIDIGSLRSLAISAAHGGRVVHVGYSSGFEGYGQIVDVEVAPGVETLYAHLAAMAVQVGQLVHAGETIGTAGCTGICYGTHLHFEVRVNGTPVNPVPLLDGN